MSSNKKVSFITFLLDKAANPYPLCNLAWLISCLGVPISLHEECKRDDVEDGDEGDEFSTPCGHRGRWTWAYETYFLVVGFR